jgi:O-antigen/teichoic acid export membrane protein
VTEQKKEGTYSTDVTGEDRFAWNVVTSWLGYLFVLIPGFVMPRMISDTQGDVALGIWDFCWALVNYLKLSNFGIGASVSRFVAKYKAEGNTDGVNGVVSTVFLFQLIVASFVMVATIVLSITIPVIYAAKLGAFAGEVHWIILFLGGSLVLYFVIDVFRGVTTGFHRWDLHNAIIASTHALMFITMAGALYLGGGLVEISIAYFCVSVVSEIVRVMTAYKIFPELKVSKIFLNWKIAKKMASFGAKTVLNSLPQIVVIQSTNVLVMGALGPALLAVMMRPIALMRHASTFINKFSFVLTPMAGSLQATSNMEGMREFLLEVTRYSVAFTLPILLYLGVFGDRILHLWMGEGFDDWGLMIIFCIGYFLPISQSAIYRILVGLNAHGKAAIISISVVSICYLVGVIWIEQIGWNLHNAAILISVSLTASYGIVMPVIACRLMKISVANYLYQVFALPFMCGAIFFVILVSCRIIFTKNGYQDLIWATILGTFVIIPMYWRWIASAEFRRKISGLARRKLSRNPDLT